MAHRPYLVADWGTSNLRAWVLGPDGDVLAAEKFPWGVARLKRGEAARRLAEDIRPSLEAEQLPALICGMAGSELGLAATPYLDCPAGAPEVARALCRLPGDGPPVFIVPGLRCLRPNGDPDVMRGEETKVIGWLALDPARSVGRRALCLPGTHPKWILIRDGRIERFLTVMSGELFEVLSQHSVLRSEADPDDAAAFAEGLKAGALGGSLTARLFAARSKVVGGGGLRADQARSYLSGLLVGDDAAQMPRALGLEPGSVIGLAGEGLLCRPYGQALMGQGYRVEETAGDGPVLAGLKRLHDEALRC